MPAQCRYKNFRVLGKIKEIGLHDIENEHLAQMVKAAAAASAKLGNLLLHFKVLNNLVPTQFYETS